MVKRGEDPGKKIPGYTSPRIRKLPTSSFWFTAPKLLLLFGLLQLLEGIMSFLTFLDGIQELLNAIFMNEECSIRSASQTRGNAHQTAMRIKNSSARIAKPNRSGNLNRHAHFRMIAISTHHALNVTPV